MDQIDLFCRSKHKEMYKCLKHIIILTFFLQLSGHLFAQEKYEKESRAKEEDIPTKAIQFVDTLALDVKVKWLKEEGLQSNSFEAKFKWEKVRYSIEFDTLGAVEDIEVEKKWSDLNAELRATVLEQLNNDCQKHKIDKVQIQYTGKPADLITLFNGEEVSNRLTVQYEIIVKCRKKEDVNLYEYLFSDSGIILSISKIVFKNSSHLEY